MKAHFCFAYLHHDAALKSVFRKLRVERYISQNLEGGGISCQVLGQY